MAFSDLVKQNNNIFLQKQYDGVRANIEQKPHRASLSAILQFYHILFFTINCHFLELIRVSRW